MFDTHFVLLNSFFPYFLDWFIKLKNGGENRQNTHFVNVFAFAQSMFTVLSCMFACRHREYTVQVIQFILSSRELWMWCMIWFLFCCCCCWCDCVLPLSLQNHCSQLTTCVPNLQCGHTKHAFTTMCDFVVFISSNVENCVDFI